MWCNEGLECIIDLKAWQKEHDDWEKKYMWQTLKQESLRDIEPKIPLQMMIMRAQANHHRKYEIYTITTERSITEKVIKDMFESTPQAIVNLIRERGEKIYANRYDYENSKIVIR